MNRKIKSENRIKNEKSDRNQKGKISRTGKIENKFAHHFSSDIPLDLQDISKGAHTVLIAMT